MKIAYERATSNAVTASRYSGALCAAYVSTRAWDPIDAYLHGAGIPNVFLRGVAS